MPKQPKTKRVPRTISQLKRHRTARVARLGARALYLHRRGKEQKMYALICDEFISLGGVYIKFLQGVLLQSGKFKVSNGIDRLKVFENLDSEPLDIQTILHNELGARITKSPSSNHSHLQLVRSDKSITASMLTASRSL